MTQAHCKRFFVRVVKRGDFIEEILFMGADGSMGSFKDAVPTTGPVPRTIDGLQEVKEDQLLAFMMTTMNDRHDLFAFRDFANVCGDSHGNPAVFRFAWTCPGCGHEVEHWWSDISERQSCSKCRHEVATENTTIDWEGPDNPMLVELWESLPTKRRISD